MRRFAETAERIAATTSKLEKVRLLAEYLQKVDETRVGVAARFFAGLVFPTWDMRVLSVGGAALWGVLRSIGDATSEDMSAAWARHGDAGGAAHDVLLRACAGAPGVDILDVVHTFEGIAAASSTAERASLLEDLLRSCTPLEAKYVVKLITGEMRIGLREGLVEEAIALAFARDRTAVSRADMVIGDLGEVALLARQDRLGEAAPRLFAPMRFMLASPVADAAEVVARMGDEVWVEDKYDGVRCQVHRDSGRVMLFSRDLKDITSQFPEVAEAAADLPGEMLLDGEVLAYRDGRVMPFAALQTRLGRKAPALAVMQRVPVIFVAWDVLYQDGESLLDESLRSRRARLDALHLGGALAAAHQEHARGAGAVDALFDNARARLNEGLIAKDPDSPYTPGRRGLSWLKLKKPLDTLDVVVTGAELGHGKRRDVLSDVTFSVRVDDSDELVPIGKAYTGLTDVEIAEMTELLTSITVSEQGRYRAVIPQIVLEIAFDRVQPSSRHRSGYALRFPRIARWRHDKPVAEIDTLSRVAALAQTWDGEKVQLVDRAE
ncbi:MAG TPA: ATP-dependent DNA ligase [Candidatus Dormibacteraeota bacterium]|jgi:DNA ligase-1|nr:ATP-dependent DNA ligase [Candidatus Dormibacteraeota bacterium]